ncbi:MAG: sulfurtransferase [Proteobacteria bacterium]|nr:sulfurtransferase [Pseudomonadota bacterium]
MYRLVGNVLTALCATFLFATIPVAAVLVTAVLVTAMSTPGLAAEKSAIVDTTFVADAAKRGAIVWDVRSRADYVRGHIPGAVNIDFVGSVLRDPNSEDYIATDKIETLLGGAGIDPAKEIIVYGNKGDPFVYFGLVTVQHFSGKNAAVYHGGIDDWKAAGRPLATEATTLPPVALKLTVDPSVTVSTRDVLKHVNNANVQILDVRTAKEYGGEDIRAIRGGHIPNAVNIPYEQNWVDADTPAKLARKAVSNKDGMSLKSKDQLKALYAKLDPTKETVVYCQSGVRASETAIVLRDLGFKNVKVYDSSWLGYGNTLDAPAEKVTYFNVGLLNGRLAGMQARIEQLEKELAQSKAAK